MVEDLDTGAYVEVLGTVVHGVLGRAIGFGHSSSLKELSSDDTRVTDVWLVHRNHVVGQMITNDESTAFVLWLVGVLHV